MVPGRFGCSTRPSTSSSGMIASSQAVDPTWASAASTKASVSSGSGTGPETMPAAEKSFQISARSRSRTARSAASSRARELRPNRQVQSMSRPRHQPATVGRSWYRSSRLIARPTQRAA